MTTQGVANLKRLTFLVLGLVLAAGLFVRCGRYDGPTEGDVLPLAVEVFPGSTTTYHLWVNEKTGRDIDNEPADRSAALSLTVRLAEPTERSKVQDWYRLRLQNAGFKDCPPGQRAISIVLVLCKSVGSRNHRFLLGIKALDANYDPLPTPLPPADTYSVTYLIE
jgi:hypothetical protein